MPSYKHELRAGQTLRARLDGLGGVMLDLIEGAAIIDTIRFDKGVTVTVEAAEQQADPRMQAGATVIHVDFERRQRK